MVLLWLVGVAGPAFAQERFGVVLDSVPPRDSNNPSAEFKFHTVNGGRSTPTWCLLDGVAVPMTWCVSPMRYEGLREGVHTFEVQAWDGFPEGPPVTASYGWTVDLTAPETRIDAGPPSPTNAPIAAFAFTSPSTDIARYECRLDTARFATCRSPRDLSGLGAGAHTFDVRAIDNAGNTDASPAHHAWTIDVTAPETRIDAGPPPTSPATTATFAFASPSPDVTRFECRRDGADFATCTSPRTFTDLPLGGHTFDVRAIDSAGNADESPAGAAWTIQAAPRDTLTLATDAASAQVGTEQTVIATLVDHHAQPVSGIPLRFAVIEGPHRGVEATVTTAADGGARFAYTGTSTGTDMIQASYQDAGGRTEISSLVERTWTIAPERSGPADRDRDGVPDISDNCPETTNADQADRDTDALGDVCDSSLPSGDLPVIVGEVAQVKLISGNVYIKLPNGSRAALKAAPSLGFVPLKGAATVPIGSEIDAREGALELTTAATFARGRAARLQRARISAALFSIRQARRAATSSHPIKGLKRETTPTVDFVLQTPRGRERACAPSNGPLKGAVRTFSGSGKGVYRTIGGASSTLITDAAWIVQDRCDGTLTEVGRGTARVHDSALHKTVLVRGGQAYLAKARLFAAKRQRTELLRRNPTQAVPRWPTFQPARHEIGIRGAGGARRSRNGEALPTARA